MEMVAGVVFRQEPVRFAGVLQGLVEVDAAVDQVGGADEIVIGVADFLAEGSVGAPAAHGKQGADIDLVAKFPGLGDVEFQTVDEILRGGHIAHGTEDIALCAHGMDDVVDALLDDDGVGTVGGDFVGESVGAHEAVGFVLQAAVLPQDPGAAGGTADDGGTVVAVFMAAQLQVVGPILGGDGVAVADDGAVFLSGEDRHIAEEVEQVGVAGIFQVEVGKLRGIAVGIQTLGQGAAGVNNGAHQGEICQIEADLDQLVRNDRHFQGIGNHGAFGRNGDAFAAAKGQGIEPAAVENGGFGQGHRLGAAVIVKGQPDGGAVKGDMDGVADGDVLGIAFRAVFGDGYRIAPNTDPFGVVHHGGFSFILITAIIR